MHDCYQQQNPLNEAPLNENTIIPLGVQEERRDCFFFCCCCFFFPPRCNKCSMESIGACECMKVQTATQNGNAEDETGEVASPSKQANEKRTNRLNVSACSYV